MSEIKIGRHNITINHQDLVLFPQAGLTKGDLITYYQTIAPIMIPHLRNRPISMQRFPDGINNEGFFHKDAPEYFPSFIKRFPIKKQTNGFVNQVVCNNDATLVYLANQACVTIHTWLSKIDKIEYPDRMIFDLDPSGKDFKMIQKAACMFHDFLQELELTSFAMLTGSRGIHVVVPLKRQHPFDWVRALAHEIGTHFSQKNPHMFTMEIRKEKRGERIFVDTLRNAFGQTGVAPYSVRAKPYASVATPILWSQVADPKTKPDMYTISNIFPYLEKNGDPWQSINKHTCSLTQAADLMHNLKKNLHQD
jgi:bifunctional non-homologous end joining protein LigD